MASLDTIFDELIANLQLVIDQIKDETSYREESTDFSREVFWRRAYDVVKAISHEATKICLAFSAPPVPDAKSCRSLKEGIEKSALTLVSVQGSLPITQGLTLLSSLRKCNLRIIYGLKSLVTNIRENGYQSSAKQLQATGTVWEACNQFPSLPTDNRLAVCQVLRREHGLMKDAVDEIEEAKKEAAAETEGDKDEDHESDEEGFEAFEEERWTQEDLTIVTPALGVLKAARTCVKKCTGAVERSGRCDSNAAVTEMDRIAECSDRVCPVVDDMVAALYPPMNRENLLLQIESLDNQLQQLLHELKHSHVSCEDDASWIEFLTKAVNHNTSKIKAQLHL